MDIISEIGLEGVTEVANEEQARNWVLSLLEDMQAWRDICTVYIPNPSAIQVNEQRRALWSFLQKQGKVMGALQTLLLTRQINEIAYKELKQKALNSLGPTIVGSM